VRSMPGHLAKIVRVGWGLPNTMLGVVFAALSFSWPRWHGGVLVAITRRGLAARFLSRRGYTAITLGRVMISTVPLSATLWEHELEHVDQAERWGLIFLPAYLYWHLRVGYRRNPFERAAEARAARYLGQQGPGGCE